MVREVYDEVRDARHGSREAKEEEGEERGAGGAGGTGSGSGEHVGAPGCRATGLSPISYAPLNFLAHVF